MLDVWKKATYSKYMNIRDLHNLIEMIPEAALEYIANRMVGQGALTRDEVKTLTTWVSKNERIDRDQTMRSILLMLTPNNIMYISNPTEEEQFKVVTQDPLLIARIDNPSEAIQMAAVNTGPHKPGKIFSLVENPSNALVLAKIAEDPRSIMEMTNITVEQQMAAVNHLPNIVSDYRAKEWDESVKRQAFNLDPSLFLHMDNPTEEECWVALYDDVKNLQYIKNPTDEMKSFAIIVA